ncbi:N-acetylglucosamine kinase [Ferrimonas gelatinilytica]|uniref:BadF/BadG/BcrA/BcrD ATPase family protein n=1 Tax=Ferrimonas gelatinilytica TaxID=1255257 RepID=A0ABP9S4B3_9GAMM
MNNKNKEMQPMILGIDGGGSKCRAVLFHPEEGVIGTGLSGAANPVNGLAVAQASIIEACELALQDAGLGHQPLSQCVVGAGLAGVNLPSCEQAMIQWQHPFAAFHLTTDLHIACLGAHGHKDGAIMITGTGSCGYLSLGGQGKIIGGHGFPQGDKGSGAWFGLRAIQQALEASDGLAADTLMTELLAQHFGSSDPMAWVEQIAGQRSTAYAKLAAVVFQAAEHGDAVAQATLSEGTAYIDQLAQQLLNLGAPRLALLGGLGPLLIPYLAESVQARLHAAEAAPEVGAVYYAQDALASQANQ